jgi:hypothetical protein
MEGSEVAAEAGIVAFGFVGAKLRDGSGYHCLLRKNESVVDIDGIDKMGSNPLTDTHGEMVVDADGQRRAGWYRHCRCLAKGDGC